MNKREIEKLKRRRSAFSIGVICAQHEYGTCPYSDSELLKSEWWREGFLSASDPQYKDSGGRLMKDKDWLK